MEDPIGGFNRIRDLYITYLETAFRTRDAGVTAERRDLLERPGMLCTEPLVEPIPRYETVEWDIHGLAHDGPTDKRVPGFSPEERRAFVDLALSGLLDSRQAAPGAPTVREALYPLYRHQAQMLKRGVQEGKPGIVASGTGSGKTEAFLLPVIAKLAQEATHWPRPADGYLARRWWQDSMGQPYAKWTDVPNRPTKTDRDASPFRLQREGEHPGRPAAVRALVLYPMNALVEDQLTRIRRALDSDVARGTLERYFGGNRIFFGRYTSDTKVTDFHRHPRPVPDKEYKRRDRKLEELFHASLAMQRTHERARALDAQRREDGEDDIRFLFPSVDGGELTTRWDMQATPPDIFITNITMLNAILAREVDAPILDKTRKWLLGNNDAYFFLILDELHLQRGSAGTEVCFLLRLLFDRLGLTDPAHRHKLRILASSASLPMEGPGQQDSVNYLWDMFGRYGTWSRGGITAADRPEAWSDAVIAGKTIDETPDNDHRLESTPFYDLVAASRHSGTAVAALADAREHESLWRRIDKALNPRVPTDVSLEEIVRRSITEAGARLAHACWSDADGRSRATKVSTLAQRLFGGSDEASLVATQGLLLVRGAGERWADWWRGIEEPAAPSFRIHTFFRSIDGLFAAAGEQARNRVEQRFSTPDRVVGPLSIDRGLRFERTEHVGVGNRIIELIYCESCGELFFGGRRGTRGDSDDIELLPSEPELETLPDAAMDNLFETLTAENFALFWPSNNRFWPHTDVDPEEPLTGKWLRASFDPRSGMVRPAGLRSSAPPASIPGYLFYRAPGGEDLHQRKGSDAGTAVPYECPACATDYSRRRANLRLSPIRNFRTGFAKTTQLLATELFGLLKLRQAEPKLVSFSDSRQDAARAALDIESRHHEDLRREVLIRSLREVAESRPSKQFLAERLQMIEEEIQRLTAAKNWAMAAESMQQRAEAAVALGAADRDEISLREVMETIGGSPKFLGPANERERLKPLLADFVRLGIHPTDPAGTEKIEADEERSFKWEELFAVTQNGVDWRDDDVFQSDLNKARLKLVEQVQPLICGIIFSKTYFSLEETGLGYPCAPRATVTGKVDRTLLDAFLRVFGDAYRLKDNPWTDDGGKQGPGEWNSARDIGNKNRVRRFAEAIWPKDRVDGELDRVLQALGDIGHKKGLIFTDALCVRLVEENAPYWRCVICGRVHLHRGAGRCTRCYAQLPEKPRGETQELRERSYLAKRIERSDQIFRLRCEELTGQTDDPADRQRRFKGIVLKDEERVLSVEDEVQYAARVVDLLAVTTTMEVGIDIGPLQAVLEANMPPQRFNYQQRVGRAGRRKQAYSIVLTVCRSKSHDLYYFWHPEAITGDAPPPPFLTKRQATAALRFVRKAWLWKAFYNIRADYGVGYPGDNDRDIHGEFVPLKDFLDPAQDWQKRLERELQETTSYKDHVVSVTIADSPLIDDPSIRGLDVGDLMSEITYVEGAGIRQTGLAHTLAEAGYLPMYGMPTRVRDLYTGHKRADDDPSGRTWRSIDRDLDLAVYEFAPGSVLVKDKEQHVCVGFTGPLWGFYPWQKDLSPLAPAFNDPFWLLRCDYCGAWHRFGQNPANLEKECPSCLHMLDGRKAKICRTPAGFRTDFRPRAFSETGLTSRRHRSITAEGEPIQLEEDPATNLRFVCKPQTRTYRLNRGPYEGSSRSWLGFDVTRGMQKLHIQWGPQNKRWHRLNGQYVDDEHAGRMAFEPESSDPNLKSFWLAAEKTTDSLFLAPKAIPPGLRPQFVSGEQTVTAVRAAATSATFILVDRASLELDVDPEEFDVIEPRIYRPAGGMAVPILQITDHLINGAGFCDRLATRGADGIPMIGRIIGSVLHDLDQYPLRDFLKVDEELDHPRKCDQACYRCLQRYSNQMYHGLLDWRLGLAFIELLYDPNFSCGLDGRFIGHALSEWPRLAQSYAEDMIRFGDGGEIREVAGLFAFRFNRREHRWAIIVHPLWDCAELPGIVQQAYDDLERLGARAEDIQFVDTFELARRQVRVREELLRVWRS